MTAPPKVFVSYSHDSAEHKERVRAMVCRLREEGISVVWDQDIADPQEGWPLWMEDQVAKSRAVLVVCSPEYERRRTGALTGADGRGARWEGTLITQHLYEEMGNARFIPVVAESSDLSSIPTILRRHTHYDVSDPTDLDRLVRRLQGGPDPSANAVPIAKVPQPGAFAKPLALIVLLGTTGRSVFAEVESFESTGERIILTVLAGSAGLSASLGHLQEKRGEIVAVAVGLTTKVGRLRQISQTVASSGERWTLTLDEKRFAEIAGSAIEMSLQGFSADNLAELRLRRLLLDEKLGEARGGPTPIDHAFLETLVAGLSVPLPVGSSPFTHLYRDFSGTPEAFVPAARLLGALWAFLSGAVEIVERLDLRLDGELLHVSFRGRRPRQYANQEPTVLTVEGDCRLTRNDTDERP